MHNKLYFGRLDTFRARIDRRFQESRWATPPRWATGTGWQMNVEERKRQKQGWHQYKRRVRANDETLLFRSFPDTDSRGTPEEAKRPRRKEAKGILDELDLEENSKPLKRSLLDAYV